MTCDRIARTILVVGTPSICLWEILLKPLFRGAWDKARARWIWRHIRRGR